MRTPVIVVGAGPVGLMLAVELRLAGVDVVVHEQRQTRSGESRGVGFTARATELLHQRGLLDSLGDVEITNKGHFGGIPMDFDILPDSHFGVRGVPQHRIEEVLEQRATELGADVLRGNRLVDLVADKNGVTAIVLGPDGRTEWDADYLVGCDGGRSTVRHLAGFAFPGTDATREMYLADVRGAHIRPRPIGERVPGGMVMSGPLGDDVDRIIVCPVGTPPRIGRQASAADVVAAWQRLTGEPLDEARVCWVSTFTDATRQVSEYRRGRVLLVGDAAHIHLPAGGQGLSLGLQDAANLGWKLAATVRGWAPPQLLDTYHTERHPVGERVLRNTLAQGTLYLSGAEIEPLREITAELMAIPDVARHLSGMVSGLDIRYDLGVSGHPLVGTRMPDAVVTPVDGPTTTVAELLRPAHATFITSPGGAPRRSVEAWRDRVRAHAVHAFPDLGVDRPTDAVLVRPDGYVAWAAPGCGDVGTALHRWFGLARDLRQLAA